MVESALLVLMFCSAARWMRKRVSLSCSQKGVKAERVFARPFILTRKVFRVEWL